MKRFEQFDSRKDFWEQFPELLTYDIFEKLKDKVATSSDVMWAIHLCEHPKSAVYRDSEKYDKMDKDLAKIPKGLKNPIFEKYRELVLSPGEMALVRWKANLDKVNRYVENMKLASLKPSEVKQVIESLEKATRLYNEYDKIIERIRGEEKDIQDHVSISQTGEI